MKISYNPEIDAHYIRLIEGKHECRTVRLNEEIALNIGMGETLVGIEILDTREVLGAGKLPAIVLEGITASTAPLPDPVNPESNTVWAALAHAAQQAVAKGFCHPMGDEDSTHKLYPSSNTYYLG